MGNNQILVCVERVTRLKVLIPSSSADDSKGMARRFYLRIVCRYGMPGKIFGDRDKTWAAIFWQSLYGHWGVKTILSTAYDKSFGALVERAILDVQMVFKVLTREMEKSPRGIASWEEEFLPMIEFSINTMKSATLGFSPFYATYGVEPSIPEQWMLPLSKIDAEITPVSEFAEHLEHIYRLCKDASLQASENALRKLNQHRRDVSFVPGESVFLSTKNLKNRHLEYSRTQMRQEFIGPFKILRINDTKGIVMLDFSQRQNLRKIYPWFRFELLRRGILAGDMYFCKGDVVMPLEEQNDQVFDYTEEDSLKEDGLSTQNALSKNTLIPKSVVPKTVSFSEHETIIPTSETTILTPKSSIHEDSRKKEGKRKTEVFYPVEDVLDRIVLKDGRVLYNVSWVGFGPEENQSVPYRFLDEGSRAVVATKWPGSETIKETIPVIQKEKVIVNPIVKEGTRKSERILSQSQSQLDALLVFYFEDEDFTSTNIEEEEFYDCLEYNYFRK